MNDGSDIISTVTASPAKCWTPMGSRITGRGFLKVIPSA